MSKTINDFIGYLKNEYGYNYVVNSYGHMVFFQRDYKEIQYFENRIIIYPKQAMVLFNHSIDLNILHYIWSIMELLDFQQIMFGEKQ